MLNYDNLKKYDKSGIHKVYDAWPDIAKEFYVKNYTKFEFGEIDQIIFTGMGGSGAIGDTLSSIVSKTNLHFSVVKGYHLPKTADSNTLVVTTSVSGDTLETLNVLNNAKKIGCKLVAFSSGGKMKKYCMKNKIKYVNVPIFNSPRSSYPAYLYSILNVLGSLMPIKKNDVLESITLLKRTQKQIQSSRIDDNPAVKMAEWLSGIPMIYYPSGLQAAATRFKNSLQENAKLHAIAEDVIEACHNGIVAWERPSIVKPILLQGKDDYVKTKELWKIIKEYFVKNKIEYKEIYSVNGGILSKIVNLVYLLDYTSIYRAVMSKVDPTPVRSIDFIKSRF